MWPWKRKEGNFDKSSSVLVQKMHKLWITTLKKCALIVVVAKNATTTGGRNGR